MLDVIAQAGGFTQFAARGKIVALRPAGRSMQRVPFNYNKSYPRAARRRTSTLARRHRPRSLNGRAAALSAAHARFPAASR